MSTAPPTPTLLDDALALAVEAEADARLRACLQCAKCTSG
jgi:heterodisulfide reductase subunit C